MEKILMGISILFLAAAGFILAPMISHAEVIFEDNFDSTPDWNTRGENNRDCGSWSNGTNNCTSAPANWTNYYILSPHGGSIEPVPDGTADHTGGTARKVYLAKYTNVMYSGGAELVKVFPNNYPELYFRFWAKAQPGWQQATTSSLKFSRLVHFDKTGSAFTYFSSGYSAPMAGFNWSSNESYYPGRSLHIPWYRCDPQATVYQACGGSYTDTIGGMPVRSRDTDYQFYTTPSGYFTASGNPADGQWHRYDFYVKMNTSTSSSDGIYKIWYDGTLIRNDTTVRWAQSGSDGISGWNSITLGGNSDNQVSTSSEWIAYDDVVASTTPIPDNYVIGGGTADTTPPAPPTGLTPR
jgi:hypothetical protein